MGASVQPDPLKAAWQQAQGTAPASADPLQAAWQQAQPKVYNPLAEMPSAPAKVMGPTSQPSSAFRVPRAASDVTQTPLTSDRGPGQEGNAFERNVLFPMLSPQGIATGLVLGAAAPAAPALALGLAAKEIAWPYLKQLGGYLGQKAAEETLPPDLKAMAEADPNRIRGEDVAWQTGALAAAPLLHAGYKAIQPDIGAAVPQAFADVAAESKGTVPTSATVPEGFQNQLFAERLQRGAEEAGTKQKMGATLPIDPEIQRASEFARMLVEGAKEPIPKKVAPVEGLTSPGDVVAADAGQAADVAAANAARKAQTEAYRAAGYVRRPGELPAGPAPTTIPDLPDPLVRLEPPPPATPEPPVVPQDVLAGNPQPIPSFPEGLAMGGQEGRIPDIPKEPTRGNPPVPSTFVTRDMQQALGEMAPEQAKAVRSLAEVANEVRGADGAGDMATDPDMEMARKVADAVNVPRDIQGAAIRGEIPPEQLPPHPPALPGSSYPAMVQDPTTGIWILDRRGQQTEPPAPLGPLDIPLRRSGDLPAGEPRPLRSGESLLNPRTFDQSPEMQQQLADAEAALRAKGTTKTRVPIAEGMQRVHAMARAALVDMGMDPMTLDPKKVRHFTGEQIVALKEQATAAMDQIAAVSKRMEDPTLPDAVRTELGHTLERTIQGRDNLLESIVSASSQKGRDLNFLRQIANRSLDPDVWVLQAKRLAGEHPLSDAVIAEIRKLARQAAEACA